MVAKPKFQRALAEFYGKVAPSPERQTYVTENQIDLETILPFAGLLTVSLCKGLKAEGGSIFEFRPDGVPACVVEALSIGRKDGLAEIVTEDLVAWPCVCPDAYATACWPSEGPALLGSRWFLDKPTQPLAIFRTPLSWLKARCEGVVLLRDTAVEALDSNSAPFVAQDIYHAAELRRIFGPRRKILIPCPESTAA